MTTQELAQKILEMIEQCEEEAKQYDTLSFEDAHILSSDRIERIKQLCQEAASSESDQV